VNDPTPAPGSNDGTPPSTPEPAAGDRDAAWAATGPDEPTAAASSSRRSRWRRRPPRRTVLVTAAVVGFLAVGGAGSAAIGHALSGSDGPGGRGAVGDVRGGHHGERTGDDRAPVAPPAPGAGTTTS
jgi:hypothetical protein